MRIAHFTAGTVGAGHISHAISMKRALQRAGVEGEFRVYGPPIDFPAAADHEYRTVEIVPDDVTNPFTARETPIARELEAYRPDLLIVEMFWAPMMYLLPLPDCEHWFLVRKCPDRWFTGDDYYPFDSSLYQRVVAIEPVDHEIITDRIDPIVICNPDECRATGQLRSRPGVPSEQRLAVVAHAGSEDEINEIEVAEGPETFVARFDLRDKDAIFPIAEWLNGADAIYSAAGYNSFWESKWLGYHDRTHFTSFGRHIDDQQWRIDGCGDYVMKENGADRLASWIVGS